MKTELPTIALSIRQPWAWLILNAGKDIENRTRRTRFRGRVLIHSGQVMTHDEYESCAQFVASRYLQMKKEFLLPEYDELKRQCGGIVGVMEITDCVSASASPWFMGGFGYCLRDARLLPFKPCKGMLGFFAVGGER